MLDARQLEALAAVNEHGGFGPAARALKLTLSAVSLRIKSLEESLGQRLLVRGKTVHATAAGQALLAHVKQVKLMEADLLAEMTTGAGAASKGKDKPWQSLAMAINADSMATWFLPGVAALALRERLLLDIMVDDQEHTYGALKNGDVIGCVTALAVPMRGCVAEPLGVMRYRCAISPTLAKHCRTARGEVSAHRLLSHPAVIFNRKDALQDRFLEQHFGLRTPNYPRHFAPDVEAFETLIELGLGWGMVPEQRLGKRPGLEELLPGATVDVSLYWQHWAREPTSAQRLTATVKAAAQRHLLPMPDQP